MTPWIEAGGSYTATVEPDDDDVRVRVLEGTRVNESVCGDVGQPDVTCGWNWERGRIDIRVAAEVDGVTGSVGFADAVFVDGDDELHLSAQSWRVRGLGEIEG